MDWFARAIKSIPTASQTFSKSHYSLPFSSSPLFCKKAEKSYIYDIDDNKYIDLISGLLSISLGYKDKDVDKNIRKQISKGINYSLPHYSEVILAEKLIDIIPCAEMVRFGKNGSDVNSAAVRLARAYTGKNVIAACGYHGWHDWYIGSTTRDKGVPDGIKGLTKIFKYNDIESLKKIIDENDGDVAAVIMEPMNIDYPKEGFLEDVRALTFKHNILLIFDEIITGFRFHLGGAQSLFSVEPDIATFGKGLGNGMPISAIVGRSEIMMLMDDIFFSGTFGGEALSIAAAIAVIDKYQSNNIINSLHQKGRLLSDNIRASAIKHNVEWFNLKGHDSWKIYDITSVNDIDQNIYKTLLIEKLCEKGILTIGSNNINYALTMKDIKIISKSFEEVFEYISYIERKGDIENNISGNKIKPVFKVR